MSSPKTQKTQLSRVDEAGLLLELKIKAKSGKVNIYFILYLF